MSARPHTEKPTQRVSPAPGAARRSGKVWSLCLTRNVRDPQHKVQVEDQPPSPPSPTGQGLANENLHVKQASYTPHAQTSTEHKACSLRAARCWGAGVLGSGDTEHQACVGSTSASAKGQRVHAALRTTGPPWP